MIRVGKDFRKIKEDAWNASRAWKPAQFSTHINTLYHDCQAHVTAFVPMRKEGAHGEDAPVQSCLPLNGSLSPTLGRVLQQLVQEAFEKYEAYLF